MSHNTQRYQMFLWHFDEKSSENAQIGDFFYQDQQNEYWTQVKCWLLISSIFQKCLNSIYNISKKC